MEYFLIILLQLFGISLHVMQTIVALGDQFKELTPREIIQAFWKKDWESVIVSIIILGLTLTAHYAIHNYGQDLIKEYKYFELLYFAGSLVIGYSGQRIVYSVLGKTEKFIQDKVDSKLQ